jgi:hypothetical protein
MAWIRARQGFLALGVALSCLPDVEIPTVTAPKACGDGVVEIALDEQCDPGDGGAGAVGCTSDCRIDCDGGVADPWRHHCYYSIPPKSSLQSAQQSCGADNGHLVTFGSINELGFVTSSVLDAAAAWIDLQRNGDAGEYSTSNGETGFSSKCPGCWAQQNNGMFVAGDAGGGPCLAFTRDLQGAWFTIPCSLGIFSLPVICEREAPGRAAGPCEAGTCMEVAATANTSAYVVGGKKTFDDASAACKAMGGGLLVLESPEEREDVARALAAAGIGDVWVDLSATQPGSWTWGVNVPLASLPNPWAEGEPAASTGHGFLSMDTRYDTRLVHVDTMGNMHAFVCEIDLRKK